MSENPLAKKMKLKAGAQAAVVNAPAGYLRELTPLPAGVEVAQKLQGTFDWVQVFVATSAELEALIPKVVKALAPESLLWISFPKGTSGIQTDLTRDKGWDALKDVDLKWVTLISVNKTWSAFAFRPHRPGEVKQRVRR
ncbi:MAG: hypothetical protein LAO05_00565 [Acidobacteriia bacterium]|nr:hypothetical protein [Terriglobia bacterium]